MFLSPPSPPVSAVIGASGTTTTRTTEVRRAAVLAIGDEVLRGEVVNGNAAFLSDRLFDLGFVLTEHVVVADDPAAMRAALARLSSQVDVLVTTGGLGPTDDDRTVDVVCDVLGVGSEPHEPSLVAMKARFARAGFELTPNNLRQVRVPAGAEVLSNPVGIAPGFCVRLGGASAYFLPGVPGEMSRIFNDHIAPALATELKAAGRPLPAVRTWHVLGMGESHVDHRLAGILDGLAHATLHFRTAAPENHVKIVLRGPEYASNVAALDQLDTEVRRRLGPVIYGVDGDTVPRALARSMRRGQASLALAESCTGGYAGQLVTSEPGASDFFRGAIVAYDNEIKMNVLGVRPATLQRHGAVSEPCAAEMSEGICRVLGATVGVSITGIAGPDDNAGNAASPAEDRTSGAKPVGTVCFGVTGPTGTCTETRQFSPGRERIRRAAAFHALELARRYFD